MRTLIIVLIGILVGLALLMLGKRLKFDPRSTYAAFAIAWLIAAGLNMWIGVSQAGYSVREELPIFGVIFAVPAAIVWFLKSRIGGNRP